MQATVGQLLVNDFLPEDLRDHSRVLDKKGINTLLRAVAQRHPEKYREISHALSTIGWRTAQETGGYSFGMQHLRPAKAALAVRQQIRQQMQTILSDDSLDDKTREERIVRLAGALQKKQQEDVFNESLAEKNPLAYQVLSGSRGNKMNLASLRGSDMLYADHRDNVIPVPVLSSYSEGLKPWEYWAGTYGARKGVMDVKFATQDAGFLSKQLNQVVHRLVVEDLDGDGVPDTPRGLPVETDDADNEGALLAHDVGPYKRNTVLTPKILGHLRQLGQERILVRSPAVGGTRNGGVYARDVGVREHGVLPGRGEMPAFAAVQALSEPLTQAQISSKHTGGVAGEGKAISGFEYVNQLVQVPKKMKGGATHSEEDGVVGRIDPAPAGGHYAFVNGKEHFIPPGVELKVKPGDRVEAGDVLTSGLPNPSKIVQHKGIGEGRRYFVKAFREAMTGAGMQANRRNIELLSRGLINHVRLTDEVGEYAPDDLVPYHAVEHAYTPREDASEVEPTLANNQYLEAPALHYTVGTRVRPSVIKDLQDFGVKKVHVHRDPPPFQAEMIRGMTSLANDPDWMTRMYGSGLKGGLLKAVHRGATSDESGTSFVPSLARAVDFGRTPGNIVRKPDPGWKPEPPAAIKVGEHVHVRDGNTYDVDLLAGLVAGRHVVQLPTDSLAPNRSRRNGFSPVTRYPHVDTSKPIFVLGDNDIVDGNHRTARLQDEGAKHVPGIKLTPEDLAAVKIAASLGVPGGPATGDAPGAPGGIGKPPGGIKPLTATATPTPAATPAPKPAPAPTPPPENAPLWFGGYQRGTGGGQAMMSAMLPFAPKMGPLAPLAMMAGIDFNALGSLTGGKDRTYQPQFAGTPPQAPPAQPPAMPQPAVPQSPPTVPSTVVSPPPKNQLYAAAEQPARSTDWGTLGQAGVRVGAGLFDPSTAYQLTGKVPGVSGYATEAGVPLFSRWGIPSRIAENVKNLVKAPYRGVTMPSPLAGPTAVMSGVAMGASASRDKQVGEVDPLYQDVAHDYDPHRWWGMGAPLHAIMNYAGPQALGSAARDGTALWKAQLENNYLNRPNDSFVGQLGRAGNEMNGVDQRARLEAADLTRSTPTVDNVVDVDNRLAAIRNQDPRLAANQQEARTYVKVHDPQRVDTVERHLATMRARQPDAGWYVDWSVQGEDGQFGVLKHPPVAPGALQTPQALPQYRLPPSNFGPPPPGYDQLPG